jgi:KDO2-lipid IV(A) lauroyltransferase
MPRHLRTFNNGLIFTATCKGVTNFPPALSHWIGRVGTWIAFRTMGRGTAAVVDNLRAVRPDASEDGLRRLALETYRSYARDTIDFIRAVHMDRDAFRPLADMSSRGLLDRVRAEGRGAILATAHYGNWEIGGLLLRLAEYPVAVVVLAEVSDQVHRLRERFRTSWGIETIEVRQSMETPLTIRRLLGENRMVAMLLDRHMGKDRVEVEFLGRRAQFLRTPALMSFMTGAPLIPSFVERRADGRFGAIVEAPIYVSREGDRDTNVQAATQEYARHLERRVREHPEFWYQFYDYWGEQTAP